MEKWNFPKGTVGKIHLGFDGPTSVGGRGYLWAEPYDTLGRLRYGFLATDDNWAYVDIDPNLVVVDWAPIPGTAYVYRTILTDPVGVIEFKEADHG